MLLAHSRVLLYHRDSTQNTTVPVPRLSVLSDLNYATQNEDGWTTIIGKQKKNGSKSLDQEKDNKKIHGGNESSMGFISSSKNLND